MISRGTEQVVRDAHSRATRDAIGDGAGGTGVANVTVVVRFRATDEHRSDCSGEDVSELLGTYVRQVDVFGNARAGAILRLVPSTRANRGHWRSRLHLPRHACCAPRVRP